ncbi:MAG: AbrB/MazE/SpoVT family DNA-binding domain-containing protein [Candidatus Margulisiibacteriota bacterium]
MKHPMFDGQCCDFATVGERGQVVIPACVRKVMGIKPGDQVFVLSGMKGMSAILINAKHIKKMVSNMHKSIELVEKKLLRKV